MPEDQGVKIDVTTKPAAQPTSRPIIVNSPPQADPTVTAAPLPPKDLPPLNELEAPQVKPSVPAQSPPMFGELQPKVDAHPLFSGTKDPAAKKHSKLLTHWLAPLGALLIAAIIMYLLVDAGIVRGASHLPFHIFKQTPIASIPAITPLTTKVAANPYADWQTYQNSSLGIAFRYPAGWTVKTNLDGTEPALGSDFGAKHSFYGNVEIDYNPNKATAFPYVNVEVFGKESRTLDQLYTQYQTEYQSIKPFKTAAVTDQYALTNGHGFMINQVTESYSDLIFVNDVSGKFFWLNFREQTVNGGSGGATATDYTSYSSDVAKIAKSFQSL